MKLRLRKSTATAAAVAQETARELAYRVSDGNLRWSGGSGPFRQPVIANGWVVAASGPYIVAFHR